MKAIIDPLKKHTKVNKHQILVSLGLIPSFVEYAELYDPDTAEDVWTLMCKAYGFGDYRWTEGSVDAKGVYQYPGDEPLYPLVRYGLTGNVDVFQYDYGILAVRDKNTAIVGRMD